MQSSLGHLEGACGIVGVIKTVLVLEKAVIPLNSNSKQFLSSIDAEFLKHGFPNILYQQASISCFGFGDTNSYAVLEDPFHYLHGRGWTGKPCTLQDLPFRVLPNEWSLNDSFDQVDRNMAWEAMQNTIPRIIVWSTMD